MTVIPRVASISKSSFLNDFIAANRPVIVTDALSNWPAIQKWSFEYLARAVGHFEVQIFDDLFGLIGIKTLEDFVRASDASGSKPGVRPYLRAYAKFKNIDFAWADDLFVALREDWDCPYFFPDSSFAFPHVPSSKTATPVLDPFPYKGLFMSPEGGRTRLHKDPMQSDAILCQVSGRKRVKLFDPLLDGSILKTRGPDKTEGADRVLQAIPPTCDDTLEGGEVLFIPGGWWHDVMTLERSISITWNFIHDVRANALADERQRGLDHEDQLVLAFFEGPA
jgi:hypothetical protein